LGYLRCREWTCFHALNRLDRPTVPHLLRSEFIPSCLFSPTEFLRSTSRRTLFGLACPAWICSLFATLPRRPRAPGEHLLPIRSVPGLSQPLDGLLRLRFCGLVASRYHVQGSSTVQGFLPARSLPGSSPVRASVTLPPSCSPASRLPHRGASPSRPCSAVRSVLRGRCLAFLSAAPLFGFLPPSGLRRLTVCPVTRAIRSRRCLRDLSSGRWLGTPRSRSQPFAEAQGCSPFRGALCRCPLAGRYGPPTASCRCVV
jgi:hypothetical protein